MIFVGRELEPGCLILTAPRCSHGSKISTAIVWVFWKFFLFWAIWGALRNDDYVLRGTGLKNGWTCALKLWGSSRHSIFKMADDEWKFYTSFWRLFATSCLPKAFKFCVTEHNEDCCLGLRHDGTNRNGGVILMKRSTQRLLKQYFTFSEFSQGTVLPWYKVVSASIRF